MENHYPDHVATYDEAVAWMRCRYPGMRLYEITEALREWWAGRIERKPLGSEVMAEGERRQA